jgi:steroid 5-alpha reductase family enzyme
MGNAMWVSAVVVVGLMLVTWVVSVPLKNAAIVDIVWGLGFVAITWVLTFSIDGDNARQWLVTVLISVWGLRLSAYLFRRNHGKGEDWRYAQMRKKHGSRFVFVSLLTVFGLQAVVMWVVALPIQFAHGDDSPSVGPIAVMGIMVWLVGISFEAIGDAQLARFKKDPANAGKVMDKGLWHLTRHPNYFGDALMWWGIGIIAAETGSGVIGLIGPVVMTFFLMRVSGVPMLEASLAKRREGYAEYIAKTSAFFPRPPKQL